jgi:hypothetical protein
MSIVDLVCASEVEEFFHEENDLPLSEGEPVGVDVDYGQEVKFLLFEHIYWKPNYEEYE